MLDEKFVDKPLVVESIADMLSFTPEDVKASRSAEVGGDLDQKFAEGADRLMRVYTPTDLKALLDPIADGGQFDDEAPTYTSPSGNVLTVEMATQLRDIVKREI